MPERQHMIAYSYWSRNYDTYNTALIRTYERTASYTTSSSLLARNYLHVNTYASSLLIALLAWLMIFNLRSQHMRSLTQLSLLKPSLPTGVIINSNLIQHLDPREPTYQSAVSCARKKAAGQPSTRKKNVMNQRRDSRTNSANDLTDTSDSTSLSTKEQITPMTLTRSIKLLATL